MSPVKQMPASPRLAAIVAKALELQALARACDARVSVNVQFVSREDISVLDEVADATKDFGPGSQHHATEAFSTAEIGPVCFFGPPRDTAPGAGAAMGDAA